MSPSPETSRAVRGGAAFRVGRLCAAALAVVAIAACGASKPGYCTSRTNLENSIKGLTSLNASSGISGLEAQFEKIQTDATAVVNSAKGAFPSQTSALKASVDALSGAVKSLSSNPSGSEVAAVVNAAENVVTSVKNFADATSSKCS